MILTVQHWRERAEHARIVAKFLRDPEANQLMLDIAALYERLAERARLLANEPLH